jgi:hypothetical protein
VHRRFHRRPGGHQQEQADAEQRGHHHGAEAGERRSDDDAGDRGTDGTLEHRAHNAFDSVGGEQLFGGQDPRQDGAVGREEERRGDAQHRRRHPHVPDP